MWMGLCFAYRKTADERTNERTNERHTVMEAIRSLSLYAKLSNCQECNFHFIFTYAKAFFFPSAFLPHHQIDVSVVPTVYHNTRGFCCLTTSNCRRARSAAARGVPSHVPLLVAGVTLWSTDR